MKIIVKIKAEQNYKRDIMIFLIYKSIIKSFLSENVEFILKRNLKKYRDLEFINIRLNLTLNISEVKSHIISMYCRHQ